MFGWRATFWAVSAIGLGAAVAIALLIRPLRAPEGGSLAAEIAALRNFKLWAALGTTVFGFGGVFVILTFIAPILGEVTGMSPHAVALALLVFGAGLTLGSTLGGRLADMALMPAMIGILVALSLAQLIFHWVMADIGVTYVLLFFWGAAAFATIAPLQTRVVSTSPNAAAFASSLNIAAFNLGNAGGAFLGGELIRHGSGYPALAVAGALVTAIGLLLALAGRWLDRIPA
jgi:DHA1 family inner membrane transport protein